MKPGNIALLGDGRGGDSRCKLFDFGIAKVARSATEGRSKVLEKAFTPGYGAPEQFDAAFGHTGPWTDVFALALTVVETVCGCEALDGDDVSALALQSCNPQRRPTPRALGVEVGDEVEAVLRRALAVDPAERFQDMRTFWAELSRAAPFPRPRSKRNLPNLDATIPFDLRRVRVVVPRRHPRRQVLPALMTAALALALGLGAGLAPPSEQAEAHQAPQTQRATLAP